MTQTHKFSEPDIDLELTMTCGQTFCWNRTEGELYGEGRNEFYTFRRGKLLVVRELDDGLEAVTELERAEVEDALDLHTDLDETFSTFPENDALERSKQELWGLRIINDEFFPCLISYLCSPQMRIERIKQMHDDIAMKYGEKVQYRGEELHRFPTPEELSKATEGELRDLGVGYRAEYIVESTEMVRNGFEHGEIDGMSYSEARERMKDLHGVGDKVADCVLLFSKGFHEAYPIDTWAQKAVKAHLPELHHEDYGKTSENVREHFGEKAGYAQEYLFHAARKEIIEVEG
jgi:N-glycosylase/DNA lyase